jgi:hypothetical protein
VAKASKEALKAIVTLETVAVFKEAKTVANITYLHVKRNIIFITSQVAGQQNTLLKNKNKHITSLANILLIFIKHLQLYITRAF